MAMISREVCFDDILAYCRVCFEGVLSGVFLGWT
jgi:hypothetical protein